VHGFAGPLGGMLHAPHGAICARLLPLVMDANLKALQMPGSEHPALIRYVEVAQILTGDNIATASDGVNWVSDLVRALNIPSLSAYGMSVMDIPSAVEKTMKASSTKGNPIPLTDAELVGILEQAL
jgi:alcohol dehydrogenase class IV